jgi:hypothetical protein
MVLSASGDRYPVERVAMVQRQWFDAPDVISPDLQNQDSISLQFYRQAVATGGGQVSLPICAFAIISPLVETDTLRSPEQNVRIDQNFHPTSKSSISLGTGSLKVVGNHKFAFR